MDTPFEFLRRFEDELTEVARADKRRMAASPPPRRRRHWKGWVGAVASLLVVAGVIGLIIQTGSVREAVMSEASGQFSSVGAAINAPHAGEAAVPVPSPASYLTVFGPDGQARGATTSSDLTITQQKPGQEPSADLSKIIRDGQIAVTIADGTFNSTSGQVSHIAAVNHGSVLSASSSGGDSGTFTLRIPAANFEKALAQLSALGTVDSSEIQGQDVTAQYVDLKAHMKIFLARRKVLFGLMQQANTIGETLTLQNQLDDVQLKIDQITGQLRYLNNQVDESTIKVDIHEPDAVAAQTNPSEVNNPSLGRAWDHAVQGFLNVLAAVTIGLGYLIPILVIVAIGYMITRSVQRRRPSASDAG
jgi:outer membrane murein-binding lipoprotein Lpp